jgi:hypothetical protein
MSKLREAFHAMCFKRNCEGCELLPIAKEFGCDSCADVWIWKKMKEEEVLEWIEEVRRYSDEEAGAATPNESPKAKEEADTNLPTSAKRSEDELPAWCKVGQWVMDKDTMLWKITGFNEDSINTISADNALGFKCHWHDVKPVKFRPYKYEEAKGLLGKVMEFTFSTGSGYASNAILISRVSCRDDGESFIHSCSFDDWVSYKATINGVPIGVPVVDEEALKGGEK